MLQTVTTLIPTTVKLPSHFRNELCLKGALEVCERTNDVSEKRHPRLLEGSHYSSIDFKTRKQPRFKT